MSWFVPVIQADVVINPKGVPGHSWQAVSMGKSPLAHKGMHIAAKVMAATLLDLLEDEELVKRARAEFEERMKAGYTRPWPPPNMRRARCGKSGEQYCRISRENLSP